MTDPSGHESYSYNDIGGVLEVSKKIGSTTYNVNYSYNSGGQLTKITYPSGRIVYYNYDNVGHLCQVASATSTSCGATSPYLSLPSASYDASSRPLSATYGNGVVATAAYSPTTFELTGLSYAKGTTTLLGLNYYYQQNSTYCPAGNTVGNNGQIQCVADVSAGTGDSGRSVAYTYDQLGRLLTANTTGSTKYPAWGLSWIYDRYGNRTNQNITVGSGYTSSLTVNPANNQITSPAFTYDAAGNVMAEPSPLSTTSTYDGEECNTGYTGNGNTATYTCDGNHLRVEKVVTGTNAVTTVYVRSGGRVIAEYDNGAAVTSPTREHLYGFNNLLAIVTGSTGGAGGTIIYQHRDRLAPRLYTDVNGNCVGNQGTYPYGELWYSNNDTSCSNTTSTPWIFTSYERDQESGNDYALARSYASALGRFMSPDPLPGSVGNPQSWNRYAYVLDDPINSTDPTGKGFWSNLLNFIVNVVLDLVGQGVSVNTSDDGSSDDASSDGTSGSSTDFVPNPNYDPSALPGAPNSNMFTGTSTYEFPAQDPRGWTGQTTVQVSPFGNMFFQVGANRGYKGIWAPNISWVPSTGALYESHVSVGTPGAPGFNGTVGLTTNTDLSGTSYSASYFDGPGGIVSYSADNPSDLAVSVGVSTAPGPGASIGYTAQVGSVPPAVFNVKVPVFPPGFPVIPIGNGWVTEDWSATNF
jgi:RHS repeat-associated protein